MLIRYERPEYQKWEVGESPFTSTILDIQPGDRLWLGGTPNYYKSEDLLAAGTFKGVLYQLFVDKKQIGLWNFVSSLGCQVVISSCLKASYAINNKWGPSWKGQIISPKLIGNLLMSDNQETHSGVTDMVQEESCHTFSGDGYATQDQIRNYDSRYYNVFHIHEYCFWSM